MSQFNVGPEFSQEKQYAAIKAKQQQQKQTEQQDQQAKTQQNQSTGFQWATSGAETANPQIVQDPKQTGKSQMQNTQSKPTAEIMPNLDDVATLSTTVSINKKSVAAPQQKGLINLARFGLNAAALEESYKEIYKKSKSHNLIMERFFANVKLAGLGRLLSLAGMPAAKMEEIKAEVREEALAEIDAKLKQDWANSKAMIDIIWG